MRHLPVVTLIATVILSGGCRSEAPPPEAKSYPLATVADLAVEVGAFDPIFTDDALPLAHLRNRSSAPVVVVDIDRAFTFDTSFGQAIVTGATPTHAIILEPGQSYAFGSGKAIWTYRDGRPMVGHEKIRAMTARYHAADGWVASAEATPRSR